MALFRKKPVVIEARQFVGTRGHRDLLAWVNESGARLAEGIYEQNGRTIAFLLIHTLEGDHKAEIGDWIIKGVAGEFYPCKPDIFEATYESVSETTDEH